MTLKIPIGILTRIHAHGEAAYPDEGAGLLLGTFDGDDRRDHRLVTDILPLPNAREESARHNRYMIDPLDMLRAEEEADQRGLNVLGVFHSHPDGSNHPSEFDREWALPWFSYVITGVQDGCAVESRCWRLTDDRSRFNEEQIVTSDGVSSSLNNR